MPVLIGVALIYVPIVEIVAALFRIPEIVALHYISPLDCKITDVTSDNMLHCPLYLTELNQYAAVLSITFPVTVSAEF